MLITVAVGFLLNRGSSVKQQHLLAAFLSETLQLPVSFRLELVPFVKIFILRRFQSVMHGLCFDRAG
jgi:hypothetical protein